MDLGADERRGKQARQLLGDPLLIEAFGVIEDNYVRAWRASLDGEAQARERIWLALRILTTVKRHLEAVVEGGTLAAEELQELSHAA